MSKTSAADGTLVWERSYDDNGVSGYIIYLDGQEIGRRNDAGIGFSQTGLIPGVSYDYQVAAFDSDGNVSPRSVVFTTNGSLFVPDRNMAPAPLNADFNPVPITGDTPVNTDPVEPVPVTPAGPVEPTPVAPVDGDPIVTADNGSDNEVDAPIVTADNGNGGGSSGGGSFDILLMLLFSSFLAWRLATTPKPKRQKID